MKKVRLDYNPKSGRFHIDRHPKGLCGKNWFSLGKPTSLEMALEFMDYGYFTLDCLIRPLKVIDMNKEFKLFLKTEE